MKSFVVLASLLMSVVGSLASAEMKGPGTFVPSECGSYSQGSVCFGTKAGLGGSFLQVAGNNGVKVVFEIAKSTPINGGINPQAQAATLDLRSAKYGKAVAVVRTMNGKMTTVTVHFNDGGQITASDFHIAVVTL